MARNFTNDLLCLVAVSVASIAVETAAVAQEAANPALPPLATAPSAVTAPPAGPVIDQYIPPIESVTLGRSLTRPALPVPEGDFAAAATKEPIPVWYIAPPWYSVRRPNRTLYPFKHRPLYFEDVAAERCGDSWGCLQPGVSFVKFSADFLLLPCSMCRDCPNECIPAGRDCPVDLPARKHPKARSTPRKPSAASVALTPAPATRSLPPGPAIRPVSAEMPSSSGRTPVAGESRVLTGPILEGTPLPAVSDLEELPEFARHPANRPVRKAR
ncbi:MAG: hypothetical protein ACKO2P_01930 [Planctomycetota bacterium]